MFDEKRKTTTDPDVALWQLFRRTYRVMVKVRQTELDKYGISLEGSSVMFAVSVLGRQATPTMIARYLFLEPNSVSQLLTRMQNDGLVQRIKDLERKNYARVEFTKKGRSVFRKCIAQRSVKSIVSVLSEVEQEQMWNLLAKLRERSIERLKLKRAVRYPPADRRAFLNPSGPAILLAETKQEPTGKTPTVSAHDV